MGTLKQDLAVGAQLIETHTAWVFLHEHHVFKVKKPVNFGFLDFTTLEKRRQACEAEVILNSRLATDVYLEVVPVSRTSEGVHELSGAGEIVDFAVKMKRLSDAGRADVLLEQGQLSKTQVDSLAISLARFHARMPSSAGVAQFGIPERLAKLVEENFAQTSESIERYLSPDETRELRERQIGFLTARRDLLIARALSGKVRDGHGDLRLEHVYFKQSGPPTIIDCIEFNDKFRYGDVCADIAFLSMDLARLGRVDLAERLLAVYAREANDFDLFALIDFYEGYRAFVRAKVATMLQDDTGAPLATRQEAGKQARRHYVLALASGRAPFMPPALVAVGGIIASGKSTVADFVSGLASAPVVSSDRTRKHMLGLEPGQSASEGRWAGAYAPEFTARVYTEVLRRAARVLQSERPVVIDASFSTREFRQRARLLAKAYQVPFYFVECRADLTHCRQRLERRAEQPGVSDARVDLLQDFAANWETVDELEHQAHIVLDTSRPLAESHSELSRRLPVWPDGLTQ